MDDFEHDFREGCGCDLCVAVRCDLDEVCDAARDAWIAGIEASDWPAGSELPWELASTPANDVFDAGEAA